MVDSRWHCCLKQHSIYLWLSEGYTMYMKGPKTSNVLIQVSSSPHTVSQHVFSTFDHAVWGPHKHVMLDLLYPI